MSVSETDAGGFDWGTLTSADAAPDEGSPAEVDLTPTEDAGEAATAPVVERPRDPETGQFVKQATPEQMDAAAAKYQGNEEKILQALAESQSYIGDLHREKAEWKQQMHELVQAVQNPRAQPNIQALVEDNQFEQAAWHALTSGDQTSYDFIKKEWDQYSPGTPKVWEQNLQLQNRLAEVEQRVAGVQAPIAEQQNLRMVASALSRVQAANPDFEQLQPAMGQVVEDLAASGYDWVSPALESGDPVKAEAALSHIVQLARARASGNLQDQARMAAQEHVAATEQAKREAIVASASSSMSEQHEKTVGQAVADQWGKFDISALKYS